MKKKNITSFNDKGLRHGYSEHYWSGQLYYKSFFHNGTQIGYEEWYTSNANNLNKLFHII